jgi:hypothetical protein
MVSFVAFHERGLGMPPSRFMRALLHYYKVELHHLAPNSIRRLPFLRRSMRGTWGWNHNRICGSTSSRRSMQGAAPFKSGWVEVSSTSRRSSCYRTTIGTTGGSTCVTTTTGCRGSSAGS